MKKKKIASILCISAVVLFFIGELILRNIGFCHAVLYVNDEYCGYRMLENQDVKRFGNHIITNEYSMRSESLKDNEYRILMLGDSVLNGGTQVDHEELASTILEKKFQEEYSDINPRILNISTGGWGIDNCMGIIKEYGDFDCHAMVLVLNSHDYVGKINKNAIAGKVKNFPEKQYPLASIELIDRYLIPKIKSKLNIQENIDSTNTSIGDEVSEGWNFFVEYCKEKKLPLILYLHGTEYENSVNRYTDYGNKIIEMMEENVILIRDAGKLEKEDYIDFIHLNDKGQKKMSEILYSELNKLFINN